MPDRRAHAIKDAPGRRCELKALAFASRDVRGGGLNTLAENGARYFGLSASQAGLRCPTPPARRGTRSIRVPESDKLSRKITGIPQDCVPGISSYASSPIALQQPIDQDFEGLTLPTLRFHARLEQAGARNRDARAVAANYSRNGQSPLAPPSLSPISARSSPIGVRPIRMPDCTPWVIRNPVRQEGHERVHFTSSVKLRRDADMCPWLAHPSAF